MRRLGLLQQIARTIAEEPQLASDFYDALELLAGEDISGYSAVDLLEMAVGYLGRGGVADIWEVAFRLRLLNENQVQRWIIYGGLTDGSSDGSRRSSTG